MLRSAKGRKAQLSETIVCESEMIEMTDLPGSAAKWILLLLTYSLISLKGGYIHGLSLLILKTV